MKAALCVLLLATALVYGAEEKKNEKRGVLGLGYGLGHPAPLVGGYYGHGLGHSAPLVGSYYGHGLGLYNHGLYGHGLYNQGLYGHGLSSPLISHGAYSAPLPYSAPLLGLGHGLGWH